MELPLIEFASKFLQKGSLDRTYIIASQHVLPTTRSLLHALVRAGLNSNNISVIGKCYSTDLKTFRELRDESFDVAQESISFDPALSFDDQFQLYVREFVRQRLHHLTSDQFDQIIVLDDGGVLLEEILDLDLDFEKFSGIEQTSSGYQRLLNRDLKFPVVNLARSEIKAKYEPSKVSAPAISEILNSIQSDGVTPKNILVLGNGSVGKSVVDQLDKYFPTYKFDIDTTRSDFDDSNLASILPQFDLIIGCTGTTSLESNLHSHLKPGTYLASLSSSDREFDAEAFRKRQGSIADGSHVRWNGVTLLYSGFPVNFYSPDADDPDFFQFIRGLIICSISHALRKGMQPGLHELDADMQAELLQALLEYQSSKSKRANILSLKRTEWQRYIEQPILQTVPLESRAALV